MQRRPLSDRRGYMFAGLVLFLFSAQVVSAVSVQTAVIVTVVPNAPSDLTAAPNAPNQVEVTWVDNSNGGANGFSVERKTDVSGTYAELATTTASVAQYIDNGVTPATTYFYRVRAFTGGNYSPYSNTANVTTPSTAGGGGGGGGGGGTGYYIPPGSQTIVVISGAAYPASQVTIMKDGQIVAQLLAGVDANFSATIGGLSGGNYSFSMYADDTTGRRSTVFTLPVMITPGATTEISGIFLSPTIDLDKVEVKKGDALSIFGKSVPNAVVSIQINSAKPIYVNVTSSKSGAYLYDFNTAQLEFGAHSTKSKAAANNLVSNESIVRSFTVGTENVLAQPVSACPPKGDLNGDCRVNLIDFSILAYWYKRPGFPVAYDLNASGTIDLADFSIMAYYWTG